MNVVRMASLGSAERILAIVVRTQSRIGGAAHTGKYGWMRVLERNVEVGEYLRVAGHHVDQPVGDIAGECVHDPDPVDFWDSDGHLFQKSGKTVSHTQVVPVISGILGDQDEFAYAQVLQLAGFVENPFERPADRGAFDERDGAESARTAAAIRNFQVGAGSRNGCAQCTIFVGADRGSIGQVVERFGAKSCTPWLGRAQLS